MGSGSFSKERLGRPYLVCGYSFVTNSHCNLSDISTEAHKEDYYLGITQPKCPRGEHESQHHRGRGAGGVGFPLLGQGPAAVASLGLYLIFHTKSPTVSSLHFPPPKNCLSPFAPLHCHFTVGSKVMTTRRNLMQKNVTFGCAQLQCSQSRRANAFTHHFGA